MLKHLVQSRTGCFNFETGMKSLFFIMALFTAVFCGAQKTGSRCYKDKFIPRNEYDSAVFDRLQIQASFKGGYAAWRNFIKDNISFDRILKTLHDSATAHRDSAVIRFIVSRDAVLSDIEVLYAGLKETGDEAVRLIQLSSCSWTPGISEGRLLNSYHTETIIFYIHNGDDKQNAVFIKQEL